MCLSAYAAVYSRSCCILSTQILFLLTVSKYMNQQRALTFVFRGDHIQTHTGLMSMVLSLTHCTYTLILRLTLRQSYRHRNSLNHFTVPHLLFRTSSPPLLTNKFNKTLILTNYWLVLPATLKNAFSLSFFPPHTLTPLYCRSYALGTPIHSHCVVIWIVFHGPYITVLQSYCVCVCVGMKHG